jgi:hypothetical protein
MEVTGGGGNGSIYEPSRYDMACRGKKKRNSMMRRKGEWSVVPLLGLTTLQVFVIFALRLHRGRGGDKLGRLFS